MREDFGGLRVLALESRREKEIASLIRSAGGLPTVVPVMREVPLESNQDAFAFAQSLLEAKFDVVVFLTGAGARILFNAVLTRFSRDEFFCGIKPHNHSRARTQAGHSAARIRSRSQRRQSQSQH